MCLSWCHTTVTYGEVLVAEILQWEPILSDDVITTGLHPDVSPSRGDCSAPGDVLRCEWGTDCNTHPFGSRYFRCAS